MRSSSVPVSRAEHRQRTARMQAQRHWETGVEAGQRGAWKAAEIAFSQAAVKSPQDVLMWLNLAHARRNQGDFEGAFAAIHNCLARDPTHKLARDLAAEMLPAQLVRGGTIAQQLAALPEVLLGDAVLLTATAQRLLSAGRAVDAVGCDSS